MDDFRAIPQMAEALQEMVAKGQARLATVVAVYPNEVDASLPDGTVARFATTENNLPVGQKGVLLAGAGGSKIFTPLGISHPVGVHHYDRQGGIEIGDPAGSEVHDTAEAFIAIGWRAEADGLLPVAIGWRAEATADYALAIGESPVASGLNSIAIGRSASATAENGMAIGAYAQSILRGQAFGYHADAADAATALGYNAQATGYISTALGFSAVASGIGSIAIGYHIGTDVGATADYTVAIGYVAKATSYGSVAIGYGADAGYAGTVYGEVAIGRGATAKFARSIAMGHGAVAQQHYDGVIKVNTLRVDPQNRAYTKLGLKRLDGTQVYIYVDNNNQVLANTSW